LEQQCKDTAGIEGDANKLIKLYVCNKLTVNDLR